jgi:hypothetical protein
VERRFKHVLRFVFRIGKARAGPSKRKEFITVPNFSSAGKLEHYMAPPVIDQLRGLPTSSVVVMKIEDPKK